MVGCLVFDCVWLVLGSGPLVVCGLDGLGFGVFECCGLYVLSVLGGCLALLDSW